MSIDGTKFLLALRGEEQSFLRKLAALLSGVLVETRPPRVFVVQIKGWFSWRWVGFRCKTVWGLAPWHDRKDLRVPPFVPSRVLSERHFVRHPEDGTYAETPPPLRLHLAQPSIANHSRALSRLAPDACLFWVGGGDERTGRGSVMAYLPTPEGHVAWYAALVRDPTWRYADRQGIGGDILGYYESRAATDAGAPAPH